MFNDDTQNSKIAFHFIRPNSTTFYPHEQIIISILKNVIYALSLINFYYIFISISF